MPDIKLPFGFKEGRLVGTDEVERGLACGCICPECGGRLEAHKGETKAYHFAHHNASDCAFSPESAIHLAAKQILLEECKFTVPSLEANHRVTDPATGIAGNATKLIQSKLVHLSDVRQEVDFDGVVADIAASFQGRPLVIEVAVTHFCDAEKIRRLTKIGAAAVEVDLSGLSMPVTMNKLRSLIVDGHQYKKWLFNPKLSALSALVEAEARTDLKRKLDGVRRHVANKESWRQKYRTWSNAEKLQSALERMGISEAEIPSYLNYPVRGERAFPCERRVWQSAVFVAFILGKPAYTSLELGQVAAWVAECFELTEPFPNAVNVALWHFLCNLEASHCLERVHRRIFVIHNNRIDRINAVIKSRQEFEARRKDRSIELSDRDRELRLKEAWEIQLENPVWAEHWRDDFARDALPECHRAFGAHPAWESLLTTLSSEARSTRPIDFSASYSATTGLPSDNVLRALILAGFVQELPF